MREGAYSSVACRGLLTIDHASLSRRSTRGGPDGRHLNGVSRRREKLGRANSVEPKGAGRGVAKRQYTRPQHGEG